MARRSLDAGYPVNARVSKLDQAASKRVAILLWGPQALVEFAPFPWGVFCWM
jgi:hypothetical protein